MSSCLQATVYEKHSQRGMASMWVIFCRLSQAVTDAQQDPPRMLHSQFFSVPSSDPLRRSLTHQASSSTSHPTIADARLKSIIADVRKKLTEGVVRVTVPSEGPVQGTETEVDTEEKKRAEREAEKYRTQLEERVKDLQVEITCALAREEEGKKVVEHFTKAQAEAA